MLKKLISNQYLDIVTMAQEKKKKRRCWMAWKDPQKSQ